MERDIIDIILKYEVKGSKYGPERTRALLDACGSPDKKLKIVHIAGSNGKGSTAGYITNILLAAGRRVGTFTSPAVFDYAEKFLIDGKLPEDAALRRCLGEVYDVSLTFEDRPTAFEIETVAALRLFADSRREYAVVECGLGGLEDATNAISHKEVAVITSVSLEHTAILGNRIEDICRHKAGIIRDCPSVVSALQSKEGRAYYSALGVKFAGDDISDIRSADGGQTFTCGGRKYFISMLGRAQCYNAATAAEACRMLGLDEEAIAEGLARTRLDGRVQIIKKRGTTYILDGSHNPDSFGPLTDVLRGTEGAKTLVFSCLSDKDVNAAADILSPYFERVVLFTSPSYRKMALDGIYAAFSRKTDNIICAEDTASALEAAQGDKVVVLCGSFTVLKEGKQWIEKEQ